MITKHTEESLLNFEKEIAEIFNEAKIKAPVHLYSNNEAEMLNIFKQVKPSDWVLCTWRSHYQCLLKGVPKEKLREDIIAGKSISLCYPEYKIYSSAIVTGILPIAVGIGLSLKRTGSSDKVYCFVGDMTSETGSFSECLKYCENHQLPVKFIVEDNSKSVCTDTRKTWNVYSLTHQARDDEYVYYYSYENVWPHAGAGKRIQF